MHGDGRTPAVAWVRHCGVPQWWPECGDTVAGDGTRGQPTALLTLSHGVILSFSLSVPLSGTCTLEQKALAGRRKLSSQ